VDTTEFEGKNWGVPFNSNAGFIYYRTDQVDSAPKSWEDLYKQAADNNGVVYQGFRYEGLTVNFLELLYSAGGSIVSDDGKQATADSQEVKDVLKFMADGIKNGSAPKAVTTYMEPQTDQAWTSGKYGYMRNWTYAYAADQTGGSKVKGKYAVAPLPTFEGAGKAGILGGHNSVISVYTKNPGLALKYADFTASPEWQKISLEKYSSAAILNDTYDDPGVKKAIPYAAELKAALGQAKARPVSPVYPQISQAIYKNVNDALAGRVSPADAIKKASDQINSALSTF